MNWTQEDVDAHSIRMHTAESEGIASRLYAISVPKIPRPRMNKLECEYAAALALGQKVGEILYFEFEGLSLQLAPSTWYTPDFFVVRPDGICLMETKGRMREAARVRLNVAAAKLPWFKFYLVRKKLVKDGGGWDVRRVGAEGES